MSVYAGVSAAEVRSSALRAVSYRSSKRLALADSVDDFRERNQKRGITGVLVDHGPRLAHYIEGTPEAVEQLWRSVRNDPRHTDVEIVADVGTDVRLFADHPLGFAWAPTDANPHSDAPVTSGHLGPLGLTARGWTSAGQHTADLDALPVEALFASPEANMAGWLRLAEATRQGDSVRALFTEAVRGVPEDLWRLALRLRDGGASVESVYVKLIEPATRALGDRWQTDHLSQVDVTIAMSALQLLVRRLGSDSRPERPTGRTPRSALVALMPEEAHLVEVGLVSEFLERAGWDVVCAYPTSEAELAVEVGARRYDVLALCSSGAFERRERRGVIEQLVAAARAASRNPGLAVMASGRDFRAHPKLGKALGADGALASAGEAVGTAEGILRRREGLARPLAESLRGLVLEILGR